MDSQYALATSGRVRLLPEHLIFLAELAQSPDLSFENKGKLNFALGMQADQQRLPAPAIIFRMPADARFLRAKMRALPQEITPKLLDRFLRFSSNLFLTRVRGGAIQQKKPVFVVGMPRSGTSLVEKILASHPDVFGAGERPNIAAMAAGFGERA